MVLETTQKGRRAMPELKERKRRGGKRSIGEAAQNKRGVEMEEMVATPPFTRRVEGRSKTVPEEKKHRRPPRKNSVCRKGTTSTKQRLTRQ